MKESNPAADSILDQYYAVHNHGFVALIDYMGGDEAVHRAARNSVGLNLEGSAPDLRTGLINRLMRDEHTSPFEMCELKFHCAMPIFVARQWIRHRTANVNEYSGRYSKMPCMFYTPKETDVCFQNKTNKQGRAQMVDEETTARFLSNLDLQRDIAQDNYEWALGCDIARELARIDLPLSTYTQWYWKIDLHNLFHFLKLRVNPAAQIEIQVYAKIMAAITRIVAPQAYAAWENYELNAVKLSRDTIFSIQSGIFEYKFPKVIEIPDIETYSLRSHESVIGDWNA
jgi:thymidylate synthase (FAD)